MRSKQKLSPVQQYALSCIVDGLRTAKRTRLLNNKEFLQLKKHYYLIHKLAKIHFAGPYSIEKFITYKDLHKLGVPRHCPKCNSHKYDEYVIGPNEVCLNCDFKVPRRHLDAYKKARKNAIRKVKRTPIPIPL